MWAMYRFCITTVASLSFVCIFSLITVFPTIGNASHKSVPPPETEITYTIGKRAIYLGAWRDSRDRWNAVARSAGAPLLVRARSGPADLRIFARCLPGRTAGYHDERARRADVLVMNRCEASPPSRLEKRKTYSHELGHIYLGGGHSSARGLTVMTKWAEDQRAVYPTAKDARALSRRY
jgi:hypothetical protein